MHGQIKASEICDDNICLSDFEERVTLNEELILYLHESSPISIHNCDDLQAIQDDLTANYLLVNDIDCSDTVNWINGDYKGFVPIGDSSNSFSGILEGNNQIVSGVHMSNPNDSFISGNAALIYSTYSSGLIQNLLIQNLQIEEGEYVAEQLPMFILTILK